MTQVTATNGCPRSASFRPALAILACTIWCGFAVGTAKAATFDCGLSADRIANLIEEIGKDAADHEGLQTELATRSGRLLLTERENEDLAAKRLVVAYIRKTMPAKVTALLKDVRQARSRECLTDGQVDEIVARGTSLAGKVLDPRT